jgi:putative PIG3 family NAD(P)H quinone oxidoreductase
MIIEGDALRWAEVPTPEAGPEEVRIRVAAAGVNRADLVQRAGNYPPPPGASPILGLEVSGVIDEVGREVTGWTVGDPVAALLTGGGYAEHVVVHPSLLLPIPDGLDPTHAAALPEVWATAWLNLVIEAHLQPGHRVLVHAGGSGVGTAAVQLCRLLGASSFVTAGHASKIDRCVVLGADGGVNRHEGRWLEACQAWAPEGVDLILDPVGGAYLEDNLRALALGGCLVNIGLLGGRQAPLDLGRVLVRRLRVIGSVLRSRPLEERAAVVQGLRTIIWPALASRIVEPVISQVLPLPSAQDAHDLIASNQTLGKVVLVVPPR